LAYFRVFLRVLIERLAPVRVDFHLQVPLNPASSFIE